MPTTVHMNAVVGMPTVEARAGKIRNSTIQQWQNLGWDPVVVEQPPPYGHREARENARAVLRKCLDTTDADFIILSEDDIDLDPRIPLFFPAIVGSTPCSLMHFPRYKPAGFEDPGFFVVAPAKYRNLWWGAQCVVMTRENVEQVLDFDFGCGGFDMDLRVFPKIRVTLPCLVHHRHVPRVSTAMDPTEPAYIGEETYEGPRTDGS